jgi:hypothetical protein
VTITPIPKIPEKLPGVRETLTIGAVKSDHLPHSKE